MHPEAVGTVRIRTTAVLFSFSSVYKKFHTLTSMLEDSRGSNSSRILLDPARDASCSNCSGNSRIGELNTP